MQQYHVLVFRDLGESVEAPADGDYFVDAADSTFAAALALAELGGGLADGIVVVSMEMPLERGDMFFDCLLTEGVFTCSASVVRCTSLVGSSFS